MPEVSAFGVAKSTSPKNLGVKLVSWFCVALAVAADLLELFIGSDTSLTVSHELNAEIPSIRRPSSNKLISSSVLPCETAVSFFHDHGIGTQIWLPNMHNAPPDVDFESARSPAKCAS